MANTREEWDITKAPPAGGMMDITKQPPAGEIIDITKPAPGTTRDRPLEPAPAKPQSLLGRLGAAWQGYIQRSREQDIRDMEKTFARYGSDPQAVRQAIESPDYSQGPEWGRAITRGIAGALPFSLIPSLRSDVAKIPPPETTAGKVTEFVAKGATEFPTLQAAGGLVSRYIAAPIARRLGIKVAEKMVGPALATGKPVQMTPQIARALGAGMLTEAATKAGLTAGITGAAAAKAEGATPAEAAKTGLMSAAVGIGANVGAPLIGAAVKKALPKGATRIASKAAKTTAVAPVKPTSAVTPAVSAAKEVAAEKPAEPVVPAAPKAKEPAKVKTPAPAAKEPWEMTREEFAKTAPIEELQYLGKTRYRMKGDSSLGDADKEKLISSSHELLVTRAIREGKQVSSRILREYPSLAGLSEYLKKVSESWKMPQQKAVDLIDSQWRNDDNPGAAYESASWEHKDIVQRALSQGKPVPPEVLREYPDLAQARPAATQPLATGQTAPVMTERGTKVDTQYALVEAGDLVTSHDATLKADPRYPAALQPRDRARTASEAQVMDIVNNLMPERLGANVMASEGAPIVGPDMAVESGNARVIALKRAYQRPGIAQRYRQWIMDHAGEFGLSREAVERARAPVLVRIRTTDVDRVRFAQEANEAAVASMSATELAKQDAAKLDEATMTLFHPGEDGNINVAGNRGFFRAFIERAVAPADRGRYVSPDGSISQEGLVRIRNAVFAKAYGETWAIEKLAEDPDNNVKAITNGMVVAAPAWAQMKQGMAAGTRYPSLDITSDVTQAMRKLSELRAQGASVEVYLKQQTLAGVEDISPLAKDILSALYVKPSAKRVSRILRAYTSVVDQVGSPRQIGLVAAETPSKADAWDAAIEIVKREEATGYGADQPSLLQEQPGGSPETGGAVLRQEGAGETGAGQGHKPLRRSKGQKLGFVAPGTFGPGLFRDIDQITPHTPSLLRDDFALLPPALKEAIRNIDVAASVANQNMRLLLVRYRAETSSQLPPQAQEQYRKMGEHLESLRQQREQLRPHVVQALEGKGGGGEQIPPSGDIAEAFGEPGPEKSPVGGYMWKSPEGREIYIPPVPEPTDTVMAMLEKQPTLYAAALGAMRDVLSEQVVGPWRSALRMYRAFCAPYEKVLNEAYKPFAKDKEARERIGLMLEGKMPMKGPEGRAASILRQSFYGENPGEALHGEFELDPKRFLEDYLPRIKAAGSVEGAFPQGVPRDLKFFAEMERTGSLNPRETDSLIIALQYLRAGAKKKFFDPVIQQVQPYVDAMHPDRRWIYEQFSNSVLGRPVMEERLCNGMVRAIANPILRLWGKEALGRPSQTVSAFVADLAYQGTLGFNPASALKNLTQQMLTVAYLSEKSPVEGMKWWVAARVAKNTAAGKDLLRYCWVTQDREYLEGLNIEFRVMEKFLGPVRKAGFAMFEAADKDNATNSYLAGALKALSEGKSVDEAVKFGNQVAADTQFLYGMDSPLLWKGPLGRLFGMLHSWPVNFLRLLYEMGTSETKLRVVYAIVGLMALRRVLDKLTGLSFKSIEAQDQIGAMPPVAWMRGEFSPPLQVLKEALDYGQAVVDGDPEAIDEAREAFLKEARNFIPGSVQAQRISKFLNAATNDWKVLDARGRLRYETTPSEAVRSLFGTTVEQERRYQESRDVAAKEKAYQNLRARALDAYFGKDAITYSRLNRELLEKYGKGITSQDIERERKLRTQTAAERQRQGLPKAAR